MLKTRVLVILPVLPVGLALIYLGGWAFALVAAALLAVAAVEFASLFKAGGHNPSPVLIAAGSSALVLARYAWGFGHADLLVSLMTLMAMAHYLFHFEHGSDRAATDFAVTMAGILYVGWLGAYAVSLRNLDEGLGWLLAALFGVWAADSFAYLVGVRFGRHKIAPRLSPKKSWEGYWGGIVGAVLITTLLAAGWQRWGNPATGLTPWRGALLGLGMGVFPVLGDLGESMVKRQFGVKDSGHVLPGHGGVFDRIDSWLWALPIAYYIIQLWV